MAKRHYPSTPRNKQTTNWNETYDNNIQEISLEPLTTFRDAEAKKNFDVWSANFQDEWINRVASINDNNSVSQFNEFLLKRLSYAECSHLAIDTIINNAINKTSKNLTRTGIDIKFYDEVEDGDELLNKIEKRFEELGGLSKISELIETSLIYGQASLFIDVNTKNDDLTKKLVLAQEVFNKNKVNHLKVVAPYGMSASDVETANMLNKDFMIPKSWYVQGAGVVDSSRLMQLTIFDCPDLIKPLFNFGGVSLCQFMKNYVSTADSARQSLADIMLRYKTDIIKSDLVKVNPNEAKSRASAINRHRNNLGLLLLTEGEEFMQVNTPIAGLERISAHLMEYVSVSARMPNTILFGLTPAGLNATGEFELDSYYSELKSIQESKIKPIIEKLLTIICLELEIDKKVYIEFNEFKQEDEQLKADIETKQVANSIMLRDSGLASDEQAIEYLIEKGVLSSGYEVNEDDIDLDLESYAN